MVQSDDGLEQFDLRDEKPLAVLNGESLGQFKAMTAWGSLKQ